MSLIAEEWSAAFFIFREPSALAKGDFATCHNDRLNRYNRWQFGGNLALPANRPVEFSPANPYPPCDMSAGGVS